MSSIDDRVVRMEFDNRQFESGVSTTMSTLQKLNEALKFRGATAGFDDVQKASASLNFAPLNDSLWQVRQNFSFFGEFVEQVFTRISNKIIDLGSTMIRELTTAPLKAGFDEYELQMGSTQTIMASTGASIEEVTRYLDELNTYADKTIYSFSDMTANIGKFTNAGVDLDVAVKAIQGISNEAAVSGANAQEASRAMYNFAQALSAGYVKLIDWKSIENANMATVEFKTQLLETAAQMGTVEKTADGMYRVLTKNGQGGTMSELIDATHMFNDSLAYQWMTSEVLTTTLGRYADETTEIGKKAFAAATEVKTFSQLIDTVKESLGSGWTKSFAYVIGNLEEAKELWTGVNNEINAILDPIAEAREEMLKFWHDNGGRDKAIQAIADAFQGLKAIMSTIGASFERIFPPMTGEKLVEITTAIGDLADRFKKFATSSRTLSTLSVVFDTFFTVLKGVLGIASRVASALSPVLGIFADFGDSLLDVAYRFGVFAMGLSKAEDPIKYLQTRLPFVGDTMTMFAEAVENLVKALLDFVGIHIDGNPMTELFNKLSEFASKHFDFSFLSKLGDSGKGLVGIFDALRGAISDALNAILSGFGSGVEFIIGIFDGFATGAESAAGAAKDVGESFAGLDAVKSILSGFGSIIEWVGEKVAAAATWIGERLPNLFEFLGSQELRDIILNFNSLMQGGLLLSLKNFIDVLAKGKEEKSGGGLGDALKDLIGSIGELPSKIGETFESLTEALSSFQESIRGNAILKIAIAVGILAGSLALLASIDPNRMASGISGIAAAMGVLVGTFKALEGGSSMVVATAMSSVATTLIKMAIAVGILAIAMRSLSGLNMDELITGLVGIAGAMAVMVAGVSLLAKFGGNIEQTARGMITLSVAVGILAISVKALSKLDMASLGRGLLGVGLLLGEISAFAQWTDEGGLSVKEAMSILVLSAAIKVLSSSVEFFGTMDWDALGQGLLGVGLLLGAIAGFSQYFKGKSFSAEAVATILSFVVAVKILEGPVATFASMDLDALGQGLLGVFALMAAIGGFAVFVGNSSLTASAAASIVVLTVVVGMLADTVKSLSGMSWQELSVGLGALAGSIAAMVAALLVLEMGSTSMLVGAAAMTVLAIALRIFVPVIEKLGGMDLGSIIKGFLTMAAALAALAVGSAFLTAFAPEIIVASIAIAAFGVACSALGLSIGLVSAGIISFAAAITTASAAIVASAGVISTGIQTIIVSIIVGFFKGIAAGAVALLESFGEILAALGVAIHAVGDFLVQNIPYVLSVVATLVTSVLALLPTFIPQLASVVGQFIVAVIVTIVTWIPTIASVLVAGVISLINSLANGIRDNSEAIFAAVRNLLSSVIELVLTALADIVRLIPGVGDTLAGFIEDGKEGVRQALAPESFESMGNDAMSSATSGIESGSAELSAAAGDAGTDAFDSFSESFSGTDGVASEFMQPLVDGMQGYEGEFSAAGDVNVDAFLSSFTEGSAFDASTALAGTGIDGLESFTSNFTNTGTAHVGAYNTSLSRGDASSGGQALGQSGADGAGSKRAAFVTSGQYAAEGFNWSLASPYALSLARQNGAALANEAANSIRNTLAIRSPSKKTMKLGEYTAQGFAIGIKSLSDTVYNESSDVGNRALDGIRNSLEEVSKYLDGDLDLDPTIRPVMDLSEIQNGVSQMNRIVDNGVPKPLVGVGFDAYPQMLMSGMRDLASNDAYSSGDVVEAPVYNVYIDGNALASDERLMGAFDGFMREVARKADM